jgi:Protein kinase domain/PEGA domain
VRRVVVKVVHQTGDAAQRQALVEEARIAAALVHKNIVPVLDFDEIDGERLVILEHVDGLDLRELLERAGPLPPPLAVYVAAEVAAALDYAHRRADAAGRPLGLVHHDVSAANVLVSWEGEVKLTDFGVAGLLRAGERLAGNLAYMAPEQARGGAVDARADVFSLGVVLRELCTGANPFLDDATLEAARARQLPPLPPGNPPLAAVIARASATRVEDRYPSAAALREALLALPGAPADAARTLAAHLAPMRAPGGARLDPAALRAGALGAGRPLTQVAARRPARRWNLIIALSGVTAAIVSFTTVFLVRHHRDEPPAALPTTPSPGPRPSEPARTGTLSVNAVPWARIFVDGHPAGQTPRLGLPLRAGAHTVRLQTAGGDERTRTVYVSPGRETHLSVDFARP